MYCIFLQHIITICVLTNVNIEHVCVCVWYFETVNKSIKKVATLSTRNRYNRQTQPLYGLHKAINLKSLLFFLLGEYDN